MKEIAIGCYQAEFLAVKDFQSKDRQKYVPLSGELKRSFG